MLDMFVNMRPLNVLMLNHNAKEAGTYFRCFHFARQLVARGHRVTLMTCGRARFRTTAEDISGVRVISTPLTRRVADLFVPGGLDTGFLDILVRIGHIAVNRYDIIHGFDHLPNVSFPSYFGRWVTRTCVISDWCDWWTRGGFPFPRFNGNAFRNRMETHLEEGLRKVVHGVTTISSVLEERSIGLGIDSAKIRVIPSGADVEGIRPLDRGDSRRKLNLPCDAKILGFVGFVDTDVDLVLNALAAVLKRIANAYALIVGRPDFARQTAQALGIEGRVILAGVKPYCDLPDYYAAADVLALPLRDTLFNRARWPNKVGDYLAAGRPTVANPIGDVRVLFQRHQIGLLARPDDATDFAEQVVRLFDNPGLAEKMGAEARQVGERDYSWARLTDQLEEFYYHTLTSRMTAGF